MLTSSSPLTRIAPSMIVKPLRLQRGVRSGECGGFKEAQGLWPFIPRSAFRIPYPVESMDQSSSDKLRHLENRQHHRQNAKPHQKPHERDHERLEERRGDTQRFIQTALVE